MGVQAEQRSQPSKERRPHTQKGEVSLYCEGMDPGDFTLVSRALAISVSLVTAEGAQAPQTSREGGFMCPWMCPSHSKGGHPLAFMSHLLELSDARSLAFSLVAA